MWGRLTKKETEWKKKKKKTGLHAEGQIRTMTKSEFQITKGNTENWAAETNFRFIVACRQEKKTVKKPLGNVGSIRKKMRREVKHLFDRRKNRVYNVRGWKKK